MHTTKKILLGSIAAGLVLALAGGSLALARGGSYHERGWGGGPGASIIEQFDRSGDGRVSQADVDAVRAERFAAFDADGDGVLTVEEYEALWLDAMRSRMVRGFQRLDVDGDGRVTDAEFLAPYSRLVERNDRDGDGVVSEAELREAMRERRGRSDEPRGERSGPRGWVD